MSDKKRPVVVFDTHRGIYFGYMVEEFNAGRSVVLEGFRHCFEFRTEAAKGSYSLVTHGPGRGSKIGPPCPRVTVHDVAKVCECTAVAAEGWEAATWD